MSCQVVDAAGGQRDEMVDIAAARNNRKRLLTKAATVEPMTTASLDRVARALGDPTRLAILGTVRHEERTVGSIAEGFAMSRPAISQHLRILRDAELVVVREEGNRNFYRARPAGMKGLRSWLEEFWDDALDRLKEAAEQETKK